MNKMNDTLCICTQEPDSSLAAGCVLLLNSYTVENPMSPKYLDLQRTRELRQRKQCWHRGAKALHPDTPKPTKPHPNPLVAHP